MVTQIRPKEVRVIALNHQPGLGYSVKARLDGEDLDVCVGKTSKQWLNQIFLKKEGISSRD
ncbi:hypothetical protein [Thiolinea disciformis]|uniref:hypothetical protein n=1 Tax=Thiolinea disciformis TaxID=125614 RepID=UPI0003808349|nr:hypothetical protein [Thiolinea disciformis]